MESIFCFCGKVAKYRNRCERHIGKEPKKNEKIGRYSGPSKWAKENGLFVK